MSKIIASAADTMTSAANVALSCGALAGLMFLAASLFAAARR